MNRIGRRYPGPGTVLSNNADARSVQVRVMNKRTPTTVQIEETARVFESHMARIATSLAGFHQHNERLSDGSEVRIVSNSGMHVIQIWPEGGEKVVLLVEEFWGIPANDATRNGTLSPPSGRWRVGEGEVSLPPKLNQRRALADHPGHTTWSSPNFKADRHEIVLAWRGPRERYAATHGFTSSTGGAYVPHNETGTSIGNAVFTDGSKLWINGRRVTMPVNKIIAAAIHCPDPIGAPGMCVLRICTDDIANDTVRKVGCKDIVPTGETGPVALATLLSATSYVTLTTYTATNNGLAAGQWELMQRPHFDRNGDRLACTVRIVTGGMHQAASLDAETFAFLQTFDFDFREKRVETRSFTDTGPGSDPRVRHIDYSLTRETWSKYPFAVDFLDDTLVYLYLMKYQKTGVTGTEDRSSTTTSVTEDHLYDRHNDYELRWTHSLHGELLVDVLDLNFTSSFTRPGDTGSFTDFRVPGSFYGSFVGDLSRDTFAVGLQATGTTYVSRAATSGAAVTDGSGAQNMYVSTSNVTQSHPHVFIIWMGGAQRASGTTGSFTNEAPAIGTPSAGVLQEVSPNVMDGLVSGSLPALINFDTTSALTDAYRADRTPGGAFAHNVVGGVDARWVHSAVNARREVGYLGYYQQSSDGSPTVPPVRWGLEAALFLLDTVFTQASVPPYAGGTRPTISAPVFQGVTRTELTT